MYIQTVVNTYNAILLSNKKSKPLIHKTTHMDFKAVCPVNAVSKGHILYNSI